MILRILHKIRRVYWKVFKPSSKGSRALLISEGKVLLVKHTYEDYWYLPGGKVNKFELYEDAVKRELEEEVGVKVNSLSLFGVYNNFYDNKDDTVLIFLSHDFTIERKKNIEIEDYKMFDLLNLPEGISRGSKRRIEEYNNNLKKNYGIW